jgi:hypothetical protein
MSEIILGQEPDAPEGTKDAMHVPVVVCTAGVDLTPGCKVDHGYAPGYYGMEVIPARTPKQYIGIADPLREEIKKGSKVIVIPRSGSVPRLFHTWANPDFPDPVREAEEEYTDECKNCW